MSRPRLETVVTYPEAMINYESLQRRARDTYGLDAQGALRSASGLALDTQGIIKAHPDPFSLLGEGYGSGNGAVNEPALLTRVQISPGGTAPTVSAPVVDSSGRLAFALSSPANAYSDGQRDMWRYSSIGTNFRFKVTIQPDVFGVAPDTFTYAPQGGVVLRAVLTAGVWSAVVINNNIFFGVPFPNIGVWKWNDGGTAGFANRQFSYSETDDLPLPYVLEGTLIGNTVTVNLHEVGAEPNWSDTSKTKTINLDTQAGSTTGNLTPTTAGYYGYLAAHSSATAVGYVRLGPSRISKLA